MYVTCMSHKNDMYDNGMVKGIMKPKKILSPDEQERQAIQERLDAEHKQKKRTPVFFYANTANEED